MMLLHSGSSFYTYKLTPALCFKQGVMANGIIDYFVYGVINGTL